MGSAQSPAEREALRGTVLAPIYLAMGAAIAALAPWGIGLNAVPVHSSALRVCLIVAMGVAGLFFARRTGLDIAPTGFRHPVQVAVLIGAALAVYLLLIDGLVFRSALPSNYRTLIVTVDLPVRLLYFMLRSFNEGIIYQLFAGSTLVWLIGLAWRQGDGRIAPGAYWAGLILAHLLNLCINLFAVAESPMTLLALTYDLLRFGAPGILWAYLYRRHGLTTTLVAHAATHVFLQPLLAVIEP
jgi:hypothetical protein